MKFSVLCQQLNIKLGEDIKTVLDIGSGSGNFSSAFANSLYEDGMLVTAIDKNPPKDLNPQIPFIQTKFEDFTTDEKFDLVHCRNVLPFMDNKLEQLTRMLLLGKYVYFTFFGPHDDWKENTLDKNSVLEIIQHHNILYFSEEEYDGNAMNGEVKHWHIFTYFIEVKL